MKHKYIINKLSFFLFLFSCSASFFSPRASLLASPKLNFTELSLHMNEGRKLKLSSLPKGAKIQFISKDKQICSVSSKGNILGLTPGKTEIIVKVQTNKGKKLASFKTSVKVDNIFLAVSNKDLAKAHISGKAETVLLSPIKEKKFFLPKGNLGYGLILETKKGVVLSLGEKTSLRELTLARASKVTLKIKGTLPLLTLRSDKVKAQIEVKGKKGLLSSLVAEETAQIKLHSSSTKKDENGTKIYLSKKSDLNIKGKQASPISIYIWKDAEESQTTTNTPIQYFSHVSSTLTLNKGAESSSITTLDYKVSVIVDNKTDRELKINTPSVIKTLPGKTRKTINGK